MKTIARNIVQVHYKDDIALTLSFGHNSDQYEELIVENVRQLFQESCFHVGVTRDINVSSSNIVYWYY